MATVISEYLDVAHAFYDKREAASSTAARRHRQRGLGGTSRRSRD
jgi:hypothetical protein